MSLETTKETTKESTEKLDQQIVLRSSTQQDLAFIYKSWLMSFRQSQFASQMGNGIYFDGHHKVIEAILKRASAVLAVYKSDPAQIFGFICGQIVKPLPILHYIYVKEPYRKLGIGKALLSQIPEGPFLYTHEVNNIQNYLKKGLYNPYVMFNGAGLL